MTHESTLSAYDYPTDLGTSAAGSHITLISGQRIFDACCGLAGVSLGYQFPTVVKAINEQIKSGILTLPGYVANNIQHEAMESIMKIAPKYIRKIHMKGCTGGSTAVEQAIKHALSNGNGDYLLTLDVGHFGQTIAANISNGDSRESQNICQTYSAKMLTLRTSHCMACPLGLSLTNCYAECLAQELKRLDSLCKRKKIKIAAFLFEPITGASGCYSWPIPFWQTIKAWCTNKGIFLIADETQTFARLGTFFAVERFDMEVDAICLAKGISGIGVPGSGALLLASGESGVNRYQRSLTWGGSPMACSAINATIAEMTSERFFHRTTVCAIALNLALLKILHDNDDLFSGIRGTGLMLGIELKVKGTTKNTGQKIIQAARSSGLYLRLSPLGRSEVIEIRPRINITTEEVAELTEKLTYAIKLLKS